MKKHLYNAGLGLYAASVGTIGVLGTIIIVATMSHTIKNMFHKAMDVFPEPKFKS